MNEIIIEPFKRCGPIGCDESFSEISKKFPDHKEFKKTPFSKFVTSSIMSGNLHVYYSETGACVGVEIFPPFKAVWDGIEFLKNDMESISRLLSSRNMAVEISDSGVDIPGLGLSLYSHDFTESLKCSVDSVYVKLICEEQ